MSYRCMMAGSYVDADASIGDGTTIWMPSNVYRCTIGKNCLISPFVTIQEGAVIDDNCKIMDGAFICAGAVIGDGVFIGMKVILCNDKYPRATRRDGMPKGKEDWECEPPIIKNGASIGAGVVIIPGVTIGENAVVGAGATVTADVPDDNMLINAPPREVWDITPNWGHKHENGETDGDGAK